MMTRSGDEVLIKRSGFQVDIETEPGCLEPWHLPHMDHSPNDAEIESCVIAGARMGGGDPEPSQPMPLDEAPRDGWEMAQIAISVLVIIACVLWESGLLQ